MLGTDSVKLETYRGAQGLSPHFTGEETDAQRAAGTFPRSRGVSGEAEA